MYKKRGRKSKLPNKQMFETLYYNNEITAKEIAKIYNVKEQTVYNWANQLRKESKILDTKTEPGKLSDKQIFIIPQKVKNINN